MKSEFKNYQREILNNQKHFESLVEAVQSASNLEEQAVLAKEAVWFATTKSTGYYSSDILENIFLTLAQKHEIDLPSTFQKGSVLHVMTESYEIGGHTRVVERWIELAEKKQKHSLVLTQDENINIPKRLQKAIQDNAGAISFLSNKLTDIEKGLKLRKMASNYEYVVLHIHMHDIIPLLAFGTESFKRPVLFFNHADHQFWVGVGISDLVIDFRTWGQNISLASRGVKNTVVLGGIPLDLKAISVGMDKQTARKKLNLPQDKKIIITVGSPHKYKPFLNFDFAMLAKQILHANRNAMIIIIGPDYKYFPSWKKLKRKTKNRFKALGLMPYKQVLEYFAASDIVLDSFPMSGGTALLDAVSAKRPVLTLDCPTGQLEYAINSVAFCQDEETLLRKLTELFQDEGKIEQNIKDVSEKLDAYNSSDKIKENLEKICSSVLKHKLNNFKSVKREQMNNLDIYLHVASIPAKPKNLIKSIAKGIINTIFNK